MKFPLKHYFGLGMFPMIFLFPIGHVDFPAAILGGNPGVLPIERVLNRNI
jgi:hypothetical protein